MQRKVISAGQCLLAAAVMTGAMRTFLLIGLAVGCTAAHLVAQQESPRADARLLLLQVRSRVMETVNRLPRYLCTETVDRTVFRPAVDFATSSCDDLLTRTKKKDWKLQKHTTDRLRLDVAISTDSEMYAWVGQERFDDRSLADIVRGGATSTGTFASFLASIFGSNAATFTYNGDVKSPTGVLAEYGFRVPVGNSQYRVGNSRHEAIVGYEGTFQANPETFDLVRLTIHSDQLPAELRACETTTLLDYSNIRLNETEFLIPTHARWRVITFDGTQLDSRMVFSACHEFHAQSKLRFDDEPDTPALSATQTPIHKVPKLSPGLFFSLALTNPIDTATAAAGDPLQAKLTSAIKDKQNGVLIPKGARVTGRIFRIERLYDKPSVSLTLAIRLESIQANGVFQPFNATLESVVKRRQKPVDDLQVREDLGSFDRMYDPEDPSIGFLQFEDVTENFVINSGVQIEGRTLLTK